MAKLLVMREGVIEQTVQLTKERMTVGRHKHNDIVLNHGAVSGEHALVTTILDDSFLEDLQSTNGTFVNGHRIGKHFLQHKDVIKMAKYHLEFVSDGIRPLAAAAATIPAMPAPPSASASLPSAPHTQFAELPLAHIEVLNGTNAGKTLSLTKPVTSLGRPGVQVVVITRALEGYSVAHVEGDKSPLLNGDPMPRQPHSLNGGDILDLSGILMAFRVS
ncbi:MULTISPECIES: FHA domain-containing protein [unclassified Duganella]|uniref:FHA domain-containing protein n=1 Tax=unclassified Duganella TaxID=2636909 RepID=UPI00070218EE|nr:MULTISPECIES: FHA domain-containing protein [unclassified Duganella]KQV47592.1 phosphopeptide-binding protein [Duganella sp. Root336D2]KRB82121.1 phosphopeptide-binding protein [Duganella sp. Root198D2]